MRNNINKNELEDLLSFGCGDQRIPPAAFAVFMDLSEVKAVWDLQYQFCKALDIIYLIGRENESDVETNIYLPLPASYTVSPAWLEKVQNSLSTKNRGLILAFKDADSTVVYYQITEGLVTPDSLEIVQERKASEERRRLLQTELWRKRNQLYEMAKQNSNSNNDNEHNA
ncbi:tRNA-splicing endonuclease subunit Sen15-like isoform X1 [Frankliniella occidentalis]|uniref:tRNA-splicing endonuclease subunit Sen15-like isoform X1 n=1 Tax=Frankliniella occidentalis TaxID=133901 RepID=A0A6J1S663_FRAOC|nr:tRNA-splicing endonuclease subunit Sen15-like isoform X1 [Frankliniella occidentalis]